MNGVMITGGTGFIGSRLAMACAASGMAVRVLGLTNTAAERANAELLDRQPGVRVTRCSVNEPEALHRAMEGVDTVFHLAAAQHEAGMPASHFYRVNVEGTRNVFDAALAHGVRRVVHASTIGVYRQESLVTLNTPLAPSHFYGQTKLTAEQLIHQSYADRIQTVILRISETYGPHDRRLLKMFRAVASGKWFHIGRSENVHHPIFVDDLVGYMLAAARAPQAVGRTLVAAGADTVTSRQMADLIADALGVDRPRRTVPLSPLRVAALLMETVSRPMHITPPLHRRRLDFFIRSFRFDTRPVVEALGYRPQTPFAKGVRLTADWYLANGLLHDTAAAAVPDASAELTPDAATVAGLRRSA